jgi:hypothetical protein
MVRHHGARNRRRFGRLIWTIHFGMQKGEAMIAKNQRSCSSLGMVELRRRGTMNSLSLVLLLFLSATLAIPQQLPSQTRIIPNANWVRIYFGTIDVLAEQFGFKPLRSIELPPGDLELRVWSGFGLGGDSGRIIKKTGNTWSAISMYDPQRTQSVNGKFVEPSSKKMLNTTDWSALWEKLERAGIADIRDDSEIPHSGLVMDGISYVVEIAKAGYYRTYMLNNPETQRSEDGDKFLRIHYILSTAFKERAAGGTISCVSKESSSKPSSPLSSAWTYASTYASGPISKDLRESRVSAEQTLMQAITLNPLPKCEDTLPATPVKPKSSDVDIELLINPDGSVMAARSIDGPSGQSWANWALKWLFARSTDQNPIRRTVLTIQFLEE